MAGKPAPVSVAFSHAQLTAGTARNASAVPFSMKSLTDSRTPSFSSPEFNWARNARSGSASISTST